VNGDFIEAYTNPIWPRYCALRSQSGIVIGIVNAEEPDRVLALYDVESGAHWASNFNEENKPDVREALLKKLKTGVHRPLKTY
jgi:hypothetical protein